MWREGTPGGGSVWRSGGSGESTLRERQAAYQRGATGLYLGRSSLDLITAGSFALTPWPS